MPKRKKATRRNSGGRKSLTPPTNIPMPDIDEGMRMTAMAMDVARQYNRDRLHNQWLNY